MAAYASLPDVSALDRGRPEFTASSEPNATEVTGWLVQTAAEIDGILRARGYTAPVPVSAVSARELVRQYNAIGAAALVQHAAKAGPKADRAWKMWEAAKELLASMDLELDLAPLDRASNHVLSRRAYEPRFSFDPRREP